MLANTEYASGRSFVSQQILHKDFVLAYYNTEITGIPFHVNISMTELFKVAII